MTGLIIQARTGSSRLPAKVLLDLGRGKTVLDWVIDRASLVRGVDKIIVATTTKPQDDAIERLCAARGVACFRGDEANVLKRYYDCAHAFGLDIVVRVTSDCPFLDPGIVERLLDLSAAKNADYVSLHGGAKRLFAHGLDAEVIKFSALERSYQNAREPKDLEHVCTYMYQTAAKDFVLGALTPEAGEYAPDLRITIDTPQDLTAARELVKFLPPNFSAKDIVQIYQQNPYLKEINPV